MNRFIGLIDQSKNYKLSKVIPVSFIENNFNGILMLKTDELIPVGILAVMFVTSIIVYPTLPERVPIHWNMEGEADGWGSREAGAL